MPKTSVKLVSKYAHLKGASEDEKNCIPKGKRKAEKDEKEEKVEEDERREKAESDDPEHKAESEDADEKMAAEEDREEKEDREEGEEDEQEDESEPNDGKRGKKAKRKTAKAEKDDGDEDDDTDDGREMRGKSPAAAARRRERARCAAIFAAPAAAGRAELAAHFAFETMLTRDEAVAALERVAESAPAGATSLSQRMAGVNNPPAVPDPERPDLSSVAGFVAAAQAASEKARKA